MLYQMWSDPLWLFSGMPFQCHLKSITSWEIIIDKIAPAFGLPQISSLKAKVYKAYTYSTCFPSI